MGHRSDPTLRVLHVLWLKGVADVAALAEHTGMPAAEVDQVAARAAEGGLARWRGGRVAGWTLTPQGRCRHRDLLAAERESGGSGEATANAFNELAQLERRFEELCSDWQLRTAGANQVPNDHEDDSYDRWVVLRVGALNLRVQPICDRLGESVERMAGYGPRLMRALARLQEGDRNSFMRPLAGSYHEVWMELHADLVATVGSLSASAGV